MKLWRNISFVVMVALMVVATQSKVSALGVFLDVWDERECGDGGAQEYEDGFAGTCNEPCDSAATQDFEDYYFDIWAACIDYCEHSDQPWGRGSTSEYSEFGSADITDWNDVCFVDCTCLYTG